MSEKVILVYNDKEEIEVTKRAVVESCFYLSRLLDGNFIEAKQSRVHITLKDFSFEVFKSVVEYANSRVFDMTRRDVGHYIDMIQLAALWIYDDLVALLEDYLIENITLDTIMNLHTLSNMLGLTKLNEACLGFEEILDRGGTIVRRWGRCPKDGHSRHHYSNCIKKGYAKNPDFDSWDDEEEVDYLTEDEKERLSLIREFSHWCP